MRQYIVFDLEFNQASPSSQPSKEIKSGCPFEIIQIGAVKLDADLNTVNSFNRYVKPTIYPEVNPYITELTGITTDQVLFEKTFPLVFNDYMSFIGEGDTVLCIWGMADIKELFRNALYHQLDKEILPTMFIDLQPYVSAFFGFPKTKQFGLQSAVESLKIPMPFSFHSALYDAYYTAEIFKKINNPAIHPKRYNPNHVRCRRSKSKINNLVDVEKLLQQFEKMFARALTNEEKKMIILAYKMGRTRQFLKE